MKDAKLFLELCRQRFPSTRPHQAHNLTLDGDTVVLTLMLGETYQRFNLDATDLEKSPQHLLEELVTLWLFNKTTAPPEYTGA